MKYLLALLLIYGAGNPCSAQTHWEEYYPLHIGDFWQYQEYDSNIPITNALTVVTDTVLDNGHTYKIVKETTYDGPYPGSRFFYVRVDSLGQVWKYFSTTCGERLLYRLNANVGDSLSNSCNPFDPSYWRLRTRSPAIVFADTTEMQKWDRLNSPLLGVVTLAGRYGLVIELGEGWERYLRGAIINGKKYGDITVGVERNVGQSQTSFMLWENYPNPFNPSTTIGYSLSRTAVVSLRIFNTLGQLVATLVDGHKDAGYYQVQWSASHVPSGIYFYRLQAGDFVDTKKAILLK